MWELLDISLQDFPGRSLKETSWLEGTKYTHVHMLAGNKERELSWEERVGGQARLFCHISSDRAFRAEPRTVCVLSCPLVLG